jgi:hypothetical protein
VKRTAGAAGAAGRLAFVDFFLARDFDDDLVVFFFAVPVCPSDETAINEASAMTASERMVRYNVVLVECE